MEQIVNLIQTMPAKTWVKAAIEQAESLTGRKVRFAWADDGVELEETLSLDEVRWEMANRDNRVRIMVEDAAGNLVEDRTIP